MIIEFMRSSSYANWDFCEQQYFLNYVLGIDRKVGKKADLGTTTHKVLEILAVLKKEQQEGKTVVEYKDNVIGEITVDTTTWLEPYRLSNTEVEFINSTRVNKQVYKTEAKLNYGHVRYGVPVVTEIIERVFSYYKEKSTCDEKWYPMDLKNVTNWVWMALDYNNGGFDPRKREIVAPETQFNIELPYEWAKYLYEFKGESIEGRLKLKGTIDLLTKIDDNTYEVVDWKTGQRLNWATGKEKNYASLCNDFQLLLYHYACHYLFPDIEQIMVTIFFVRDGGPFSICFDKNNLKQTEEMIYNRFMEIKKNTRPRMIDPLQESFKCNKICDYYKQKGPDGKTNLCRHIYKETGVIGIDKVVEQYKNPNFNFGDYQSPGE